MSNFHIKAVPDEKLLLPDLLFKSISGIAAENF